MVYEQGIDWESCGGFRGGVGADVTVEFRLARTPDGWIIVGRKPSHGSTIAC